MKVHRQLFRKVRFAGAVSAAVALTGLPHTALAQVADSSKATSGDSAVSRSFGAFVDTYYAWDFNRPPKLDRAYTTQPARHAEANVNLAFVEAKFSGNRMRGRLALQFGTGVQSNYAGEPRVGAISGPGVSQYIQEATAGYQLHPKLWLDAGIFFSHIGSEGWISRDNLTYTRSLVADYSPYYESGAKLTWATTPKLTTTFVLVNGWQNISSENSNPAAGVRLDYAATPALTLAYDNFVGDVANDSLPTRMRVYHDFIAQYAPSPRWQLMGVYSLGTQSASSTSGGTATWWGTSLVARLHATPKLAVVARFERYTDPDQVIVSTGVADSFRTNGASLGVDVKLGAPLLWRTEMRGFRSASKVWPLHTDGALGRRNTFVVSSLALTF